MFDIGADLQRAYDEGYKQGKEDERRWWSNHCANCKDAEQTEPQTEVVMPKKCKGCDSASKIIEAYSRGFEDGADAVKAIPQTFTADGIVFAKMTDAEQTEPQFDKDINVRSKDEPQTETQNSNKNSNVISVYDGVSEAVRCAMCSNPNKSDKGCDGACSYDEKLYERVMKAIAESIADTPQTDLVKESNEVVKDLVKTDCAWK